jgi:hypothetical protein
MNKNALNQKNNTHNQKNQYVKSTGVFFTFRFFRHFTDSWGYTSTRMLNLPRIFISSSRSTTCLSQTGVPWVHDIYITSVEMSSVFICTIFVILKGDVQVDSGRRTGCLFGDVQFDYGRGNGFPT